MSYSEFYRKRTELLRFTVRDGRPTGMNVLALHVPCLPLANLHPLETEGADPRAEMRARVAPLLEALRDKQASDTPDRLWYWAALLLLDDANQLSEYLKWAASDEDQEEPDAVADDAVLTEVGVQARRWRNTGIGVHVRRALAVLHGEVELGAFPADLLDVLVDHALGNPAILWARTLAGFGPDQTACREEAWCLADAFRSLFNEPPIIEMLHQGDEAAYWRAVLRYAVDGNLQAVLDEYAHQLWEPETWGGASLTDVYKRVTESAVAAITAKTSRVRPDYIQARQRSLQIGRDGTAIRTHFALRYGSLRASELAPRRRTNS